MNFGLPKSVSINGKSFAIRYDFRVIIEILVMLEDPDLSGEDKTFALIDMFYYDDISPSEEAISKAMDFIDMGQKGGKKRHRLMDWEQDFSLIIAPVNHVLGYEARSVEYDIETNTGGVHWWTFLSAYMEISGDSTFAQIVAIRDKQARGKKLEKYEKDWANRNKDLVSLKRKYSENEQEFINSVIGG